MSQKLDNFSKILLATGQINYMASSIDGVTSDIRSLSRDPKYDPRGWHKSRAEANDRVLGETVRKLAKIMEEMGNYINACDIICPLDERVAKVPFEIVISEMDDTEKKYDEEDL